MGTVQDVVTINGTVFNTTVARVVDTMDGWENTPPMDFELVPNGYGPGSRLATVPVASEKPVTLGGAWVAEDRQAAEDARRALLDLFPVGVEVPVDRHGFRQYLWLLDAVAVDLVTPRGFRWTVPTLALDPYRYTPAATTGTSGISTGDPLWREYETATYGRVYNVSTMGRQYVGDTTSGVAVTGGDADSSRVIVEVEGNLEAGDWWVVNDATGDTMRVDLKLSKAQTVVFDVARQVATMGGADVTRWFYGDWLRVVPGRNVFRLKAGSYSSTAGITVTAHPAYR